MRGPAAGCCCFKDTNTNTNAFSSTNTNTNMRRRNMAVAAVGCCWFSAWEEAVQGWLSCVTGRQQQPGYHTPHPHTNTKKNTNTNTW